MTIKLIVGLANPGTEYSITRHNVGAWYINLLSERFNSPLHKNTKFFGYTSQIYLAGNYVHLLVPTTFMNLSGKAVAAMVAYYKINKEEILIVHDELNLPPGITKFKFGGSHGGHKGLRDIINKLGNNNFYRLRIGIGHPGNKNKVINFVLEKPTFYEKKIIEKTIEEAATCTEIWFKNGIKNATNRMHSFNANK